MRRRGSHRRPTAFVALAAAVVGALAAAPGRAAEPGRTAEPAALPWLQVAHPAGQRAELVDQHGRTVILRGVNVAGIEDDFYTTANGAEPGPAPMWSTNPTDYTGTCPAMSHRAGEPPVCEVEAGRPEYDQSWAPGSRDDLAQMRALGFNFIRLPVSWSQLEPTPGAYSTTYVDRVAQVVGWARQQGIYVLIDMHEDNYSRFTPETAAVSAAPVLMPSQEGSAHADGAPPWAVLTDGEPALAPDGQAPFNLYVAAAFDSFWHNRIPLDPAGHPRRQGAAPGLGLQDHYIGAMAALARRFANDSTVVGYDIMNEPLPGTFPPAAFSTAELYPFYRRVIDALTGAGDGVPCPPSSPALAGCGYPDLGVHLRRQAFFVEPMAVRDLDDAPDQVATPFSSYPGLVYAPHTYTHVFTVDTYAGLPASSSPYPTSYDQAYQVADAEARSMGAALVVGEFGNSAGDDDIILKATTAAQDRAMAGAAFWWWKESCAAGTAQRQCDSQTWSVYQADPSTPPAENLGLLATRAKYLSRAVPRATAGILLSFAYDPDRRAFTMRATATHAVAPGRPDEETVVFVPSNAHGTVTAAGSAVVDRVVTNPDGTRLAYIALTGPGDYAVTVTPS